MPIFTTLGAACAKAWGFTSGLITDQYFNLVSLLLPGNGTNGAQNNTFLDSSGNTFTITRNGNTTQGTFSPFSQTGWGNYFDGSSYLSLSNGAVLAAGTSNFTAEFWVYATTDQQSQAYGSVFHVGDGTSGSFSISLLYSSAGAMKIRVGTFSTSYESTSTISTNRWYHIAVVREGTGSNQTKIYVDGSLFYTFTLSDNLSNSSGLYVGSTAFNISVRRLSGYVSNLRYIVGTALYTGAFPPITSPLTTTSQGATASQVELLTCQNNRFLDNSSNGWTFTTSGSPSVQAFSPFAPTQAYSASAVGGSGYFDGTGDYLTFTTSSSYALTGDFTIECWAYFTSSTTFQPIFDQYLSAGFLLLVSPGSTIGGTLYINSTAGVDGITLSGASCPINAWNFLRIVRSGSTVTVYCNGVSAGSRTRTGNVLVNSTAFGIANYSTTYFTGYLSGVRIVASALTGTEVPTAPLTAITNTQLLLNFTNAGVVDATAKNVLETVGNAQISNGAGGGKWGGGSMRFPQSGTNDYLYKPYDVLLNRLSGNFTMECWIYPTAAGTQMIFAGSLSSGGSDNWIWEITSASKLSFTFSIGVSSVTATSTASISQNTWTYVAVVRNGGTLTQYINGSVDGTSSPTAGAYRNASFGFAIGRGGDYNASYYTGYIDDFRITIGQARTITTPTAPFPVQ